MKVTVLPIIGWREWVDLPDLSIVAIKAKIDTGARSSALHAFAIKSFQMDGREMIRFQVHPYQGDDDYILTAEARVLEWRQVKNSGGISERRPVIVTTMQLGGISRAIELTLTNRDVMGFRMLLGRQAIRNRFLVHPGGSFLLANKDGKKN